MFKHELSVKSNEFEQAKSIFEGELFPIELRIIERLYGLCPEGYKECWSDTVWTQRVMEELKELGETEGALVFPKLEEGKFVGEWLFDLVWVDAKQDKNTKELDWKATRGLKLACESEWSPHEINILEDFLKLTFVIADIRLFIYTNTNFSTGQGLVHPVDLCKQVCPLSRGFRYLAVGFPKDQKGMFRIDSWIA